MLYGATEGGGASGVGAVFRMAPHPDGTWSESLIYQFTTAGKNPWNPVSNVLYESGGLFGATSVGGTGDCFNIGCGAIYEISQ
jgi:hypothetical protein